MESIKETIAQLTRDDHRFSLVISFFLIMTISALALPLLSQPRAITPIANIKTVCYKGVSYIILPHNQGSWGGAEYDASTGKVLLCSNWNADRPDEANYSATKEIP